MTKNLSALTSRLLRPALAKRGITCVELLSKWHEIVGISYSEITMPERVQYHTSSKGEQEAVLLLQVFSSTAAIELNYLQDQLLERIASFYGYRAIHRIKLRLMSR